MNEHSKNFWFQVISFILSDILFNIYMYIYMFMCVCVCVRERERERERECIHIYIYIYIWKPTLVHKNVHIYPCLYSLVYCVQAVSMIKCCLIGGLDSYRQKIHA